MCVCVCLLYCDSYFINDIAVSIFHSLYSKTKEEQQQFQVRRAEEIYSTMREVKQIARKKSMEVVRGVEERWKESEQKAKAFERTRKASFNKARQLSRKVCEETQ